MSTARTTPTDAERTLSALAARLPMFELEHEPSFGKVLFAYVGTADYPIAAVLVEEHSTTVQALDVTSGGVIWSADFNGSAPLEVVLTTARSAAAGDL